ncbi:hypothetical protein A4A49_27209 [Nicotiana attenuata]|uniref:Uncharacterized protein n=1 Tax=Nicotiana attenuata TaxID=49451 RepID=A0A1J6J6T2_NICAT|nr:hypothetical protein A4A49_27209 [Nicotiana attenuata]
MISSCSCKPSPQSVPNSFDNLYLYSISLLVVVHRRRYVTVKFYWVAPVSVFSWIDFLAILDSCIPPTACCRLNVQKSEIPNLRCVVMYLRFGGFFLN